MDDLKSNVILNDKYRDELAEKTKDRRRVSFDVTIVDKRDLVEESKPELRNDFDEKTIEQDQNNLEDDLKTNYTNLGETFFKAKAENKAFRKILSDGAAELRRLKIDVYCSNEQKQRKERLSRFEKIMDRIRKTDSHYN